MVGKVEMPRFKCDVQDPPRPVLIKAPNYSRKGDIEVFLLEFASIGRVNGWDKETATTHLRSSLIDKATPCRRHERRSDMVDDLRSRFGQRSEKQNDSCETLNKATAPTTS